MYISTIEDAHNEGWVNVDVSKPHCSSIESAIGYAAIRIREFDYPSGYEMIGHVKGTGNCERVNYVARVNREMDPPIELFYATAACCLVNYLNKVNP